MLEVMLEAVSGGQRGVVALKDSLCRDTSVVKGGECEVKVGTPHFLHIKGVEVNAGQTATFQCTVNGRPQPHVQLYLQGSGGRWASVSQIKTVNSRRFLASFDVLNTTKADSGTYRCLGNRSAAWACPRTPSSPSNEAPSYTPRATILDAPTPSPCPTAPSKSTRTVSTQLSAGTLKLHHVRSRGVQATTDTSDSCTETETSWLQLSSTPMKATTSGIVDRPRKRPRLEIEEEEEEDLDISDISLPQPHDSTYEPGASLTEVSEMTEMDTAEDFEDTKYIVFESCLKKLFQTCPICKQHCNLQRRRFGTFVSFTQNCPHCLYHRKWDSQPIMESTPVGNLQLSAAVYFSGASFVKMEKICKAMKLQVHQYDTFRRHSRLFLEPAIYHKWKTDQQLFLEELKKKDKIAVGHSAKFGSYTLMELESEKILDIQLVQSNEVGGSFYMEKEGLRRSLDLLQDNNINLDYIVTDRHTQVKTFLRGRNITQYYDVWHMEKGLSKKLDKLSKDKECQLIKKWSAAIKNHMYWAASSSKTGPEKVAKWTSLINHIQNVHTHDDPEFPKCAHPEKVSRDPSKWFQPGSLALYKVEKLLVNKRVLGDVSKLSSDHQTSSLEAFHSVVIRFAPKSVVFPFVGMMC
ncbi:hypothetical protein WMY93_033994, partial [Mugilogobius chulae]